MKEIKKIGIVAMPVLYTGGGFNRTAIDLISTLNKMGKEVHLLNPFEINFGKIKDIYDTEIKIKKSYNTNRINSFFCREEILGRKILIKKFKELANSVDFIIDMDGGVFHNYLPKNFDITNYVVWRISCINPETPKLQKYINLKMRIKKIIKKAVCKQRDIPRRVKVYPIDEWTKKEIITFWNIKPERLCLYSEIKTDEFFLKTKKRQIVILGRIAPNKNITDSIKIFFHGTRLFPEYDLIILGGETSDTKRYIQKIDKILNNLKIKKRVEIIKNPSFGVIKKILSESEVIIDSQIGTSMHMPVVEAMAAGVIVLMQKNSGTYTEVLQNGKYGFGFCDIEEGSKKLEKILNDLKNNKINNKNTIRRSNFFSPKNFEFRLKKILHN